MKHHQDQYQRIMSNVIQLDTLIFRTILIGEAIVSLVAICWQDFKAYYEIEVKIKEKNWPFLTGTRKTLIDTLSQVPTLLPHQLPVHIMLNDEHGIPLELQFNYTTI